MSRSQREEQFELLNSESSFDSSDDYDNFEYDIPHGYTTKYPPRSRLLCLLSPRSRYNVFRRWRFHRRGFLKLAITFLLAIIFFTFLLRPSYTHLPPHYKALETRALESKAPGRANPNNEKIFICISLYDKGGKLASGRWGEQLLQLIDLLGPENLFVSIYENANGPDGEKALKELDMRIDTKKKIVYEEVDKLSYPKIQLPDGSSRTKRLVYLSDIRNRALRPLDTATNTKYDKILFLNDVFFNPIDAAQLLFSTNQGPDGKADYVAACSMDFYGDPVKLYDLFATRDFEGYSLGIPFYPFFSTAGKAGSRNDVLAQRDAVRVKSCWSGMAAFDAKPFLTEREEIPDGFRDVGFHNIEPSRPKNVQTPIRFRAETEPFFDACECCLLMADALQVTAGTTQFDRDSRIYINPYIRVAYSIKMLSWLPFSRRFERLYSPVQWIVNQVAMMPTWNPHRAVKQGDRFNEEVWVGANATVDGHWEILERTGRNGMYCGVREMQILKLDEDRAKDRNWVKVPIPWGRRFF